MKLLCLSDTHTYHEELKIPDEVDVVVHCGDFSNGKEHDTDNFLLWFSELDIKHKILIAGNHDIYVEKHNEEFKSKCKILGINYLQDSELVIDGVKFYGTPWVPIFFNWAFMLDEESLKDKYNKIPADTDILLSHGPQYKVLDEVKIGNVGSTALKATLNNRNIKLHIFGHIHEGYGVYENKETGLKSVNASCMNELYRTREPIVVDFS